MPRLPHPIPYQGSKRNLAPLIAPYISSRTKTMYEPFAGSAAMTIYAAHHKLADHFVVGDSLESIVDLWTKIVSEPESTISRYSETWNGQLTSGPDYFNSIRSRYNEEKDPVDLLYLVCRCVKNAVRFNSTGRFTQSVDKRRLGTNPEKMAEAIRQASVLLKGRIEFRHGDWQETIADASAEDYVYMDPPYLGTSIGRDKRYHEQLAPETLVEGLENLLSRQVPFALSYDGMTGTKEYGPPLPSHLGLTRLLLDAGRSSQATLAGRSERTLESLYLPQNVSKLRTQESISDLTQVTISV